ncbi:FHA domain-containing protein [Glaciimonas sp. GG7]
MELRILWGEQVGAALSIERERVYAVGCGNENDIVLSGQGVLPQHFHIQLIDTGFSVSFLPIDGKPPKQKEPRILRHGDVLGIGSVGLTVDAVSAPWPTPEESLKALELSSPKDAKKWLARPSCINRKRLLLVFLIVVGVGSYFGIKTLLIDSNIQAPISGEDSGKLLQNIKAIIAEHGYVDRIEISSTKGKVVLRGYLPGNQQLRTFERALAPWNDRIEVHLYSETIVLNMAKKFLLIEDGALKTEIDYLGRARIYGMTMNYKNFERVTQGLKKNVPALRDVKFSLVSIDEMQAWIKEWSVKEDADFLKVSEQLDGNFMITGRATAKQRARLILWFEKKSELLHRIIPLQFNLDELPEIKEKPLKIRAAITGTVPYVLLESGERIFVAGEVNGKVLKSLTPKGAVFVPILE